MEDLSGRVALVTGACGGIGAAIARRFVQAGAAVGLCDLRATALEELVAALRASGGTVHGAVVDVTDEAAVRAFCGSVAGALGGIDILVNTAGVVDDVGSVVTLPTAGWNRTLAVNLTSAFLTAKHAVPLMSGRPGGVIVNIASVSGFANQFDAMVYSVSKAGLVSLTKSEAIDLAHLGIRAVAICPGSVETALVERAIDQMAEAMGVTPSEQRRAWESQYPTGRFSTPEEVAELTLFLCSDRARNITGTAMVIDGGLMAVLPER